MSEGYLLAGVIGAIIGVAVAWVWKLNEVPHPVIDDEASPVSKDVEDVLSVLRSSAVLLDRHDDIAQASAQAYALGIVKADRLVPPEVHQMVEQVRRDGQVRQSDLTIVRRRRPPLHVHTRVAPLRHDLVLVLIDDRTQEHRVETIRRDFVANVSHELKTPIGALNLLAEAVAEAKDDPEAVERFSLRMRMESERLTRLVQQIIDLSRLQADMLSDEASAVKVSELVAEAVEHSSTDAQRKDITVSTNVEPDLVVMGDRAQLHAAVSNLVENAVTYSDSGAKVSVSAEQAGDDVRITVSDTGIGIPQQELDRIFERFYRVDPARARTTGGTGLGLSIVKHVAASNGGSVEVWSKPDLGSSFTLVLPAQDADEEHS